MAQQRVTVIAEPGSTASGSLAKQLELVDYAADAGAGVFKAQWVSSAAKLAERRNAHEYETAYRHIENPLEWHERVQERCQQRGLEYACSVYLPEDVPVVAPFVSRLKIAAFECLCQDMLEATAATGLPVIVSLGMGAPWGEEHCRIWTHSSQLTLLHCVSAYPASLSELNLNAIVDIDGYSDHSADVRVGAWAALMGARVIEAHLRHPDTPRAHPDYPASLGPGAFAAYVRNIRDAERAMGSGRPEAQPCERPMKRYRAW